MDYPGRPYVISRILKRRKKEGQSPRRDVKSGAEVRERFEEAMQLALKMEEASNAGRLLKQETGNRKEMVSPLKPP